MPNNFQLLWANFAVPVDGAGTAMIAGLMALVGPWFKLGVPAYLIVVMLIAMWTGDEKANLLLFRSAFLASIIYALSFNAGTFEYYVEQFVHGTTQEVRAAVAGALNKGQVADANAYDILSTRAYAAGLAVYKQLPSYSLKGAMLTGAVWLYWALSAAGIVWMFTVDLVSYALTDLLIDLGPLFIPQFFFPFTRRWFDGWLSCVMTVMLAQVLTAALASLFIAAVNVIMDAAAAGLTAPAGVDGDAAVSGILSLNMVAMVCIVFSIMACGIVYIAVRIGGGAYTHANIVASPSWFGGGSSHPTPGHAPPQAGGTITQAPAPTPQPAFTRTVGAAP